MLYGYLCQSLALLLAIFAAGVNGEIYYNKPQLCAYACYDTISALTFGDFDPELDYIPARCSSRLAVSSIYACFDLRCSSQYTPEESFGYLEAYCQLYGPATLNGTYADVIQNIVAEFGSVENVPVVDPTTTVEIQNTTVVTPQENWELSEKTLYVWQHEMHMHHAFGWSMYVMAAGVLFLGVLHRLTAYVTHRLLAKRPLVIDAEHSASIVGKGAAPNTGLLNKVNNLWAKHVLLPATFGYRHIQPWGWCTIPTRLQSILVFVYFALNFIFCAVDWKEFPGNTYWVLPTDQFWRYFSDRTGIICFANLPLVWLFAGRNDVLLWLTGWSFSTFNVFHRYAARIATVQGILHSIGYTVIYWRETRDWSSYNMELPEQWFWTGIAATVLMSVLLGLSILPLRAKVYELFLAIHIAFSLVILIFLFLHVKIMDGEYDAYLWVCAGFWVFDRFLRLARIVVLNYRVILPGKNDPLKRSVATATYDPDGDIIRLTVRPSANFLVGAGIHYYIYTPTASMFRLWENHPFTLGTWKQIPKDGSVRAHEGSLHENDLVSPTVTDTKSISTGEIELHPTQQELMFLIRPYKGMTSTLKKQLLKAPGYTKDIRILLEGPYGVAADLRQYERVLMISGGSGVTGLLAYLYEFEKLALEGKSEGRKLRFAWAAREPRFVADVVEKDLVQFVGRADTRLDFFMTRGDEKVNHVEQALAHATHRNGLDKTTNAVVSYTRPDIAALLEEEISQLITDVSRLAVVVCGPGRLADDVRREIVRAVGSKIDASRIELYEESFGW